AFDAVAQVHMNLAGHFKQPGRAERINKALFKISNAVNTTMNLDELYRSIHQTLADIIDVTNFFIALYDESRDTLSFPYFIDKTTDVPICLLEKTHVKDSASLTSRIIKTGKPFFHKKQDILKLYIESGENPSGAMPEVWLGVPLLIKGDVIGAMAAQSYTDAEMYDEQDVDILTSVAEQIAIAIDRKRAEEALVLEQAHMERLFEGVREGIAISGPDGVVMSVNPEFERLFGYSPGEAVEAALYDLIIPGSHM
ncbi:MAG: GAF domain-containing protein, partial [Desulfobacterales bacterium]|nr:GAF domain-containing protein [Desulfobacterales bacterium]